MADLLTKGVAWMAGKLKASASRLAVYSRGTASVTLSITLGHTLLRTADDQGGETLGWTDADIILTAADLVLNGQPTVPVLGDRIAIPFGLQTWTFEILPMGGEQPWRWCDGSHTLLRVHLKKIGVA